MRVRTGEEAVVRLDLTENAAKRRCLEKEATPGVQAMAQRNKKYDRQLRIWGEQGQEALEKANICVLNVGPTGAEALKNLVLGGIGSFTIVDGSDIQASDLGNNFLIEWDSVGRRKASAVCSVLHEMNESVEAKFVEESPEALIESNPSFFGQFTLVIATQMSEFALVKLDQICRRYDVLLLVARSYGLFGHVRISVKEHVVIEAKPDNKVEDLRFHKPWPELRRLVEEFDIDTKDPVIHKHIPFGVLLIKILDDWKAEHGGQMPSSLRELKAAITSRRRSDDEDNYKEALKAAYLVTSPPVLKPELLAALNDRCAELDSLSSEFWIMVAALKQFLENEGQGEPPLDGSVPDMHSFTEYYIRVQKVYQARAEADAAAVEERVRSILKQIGRDPNAISKTTIKHFCKNARNLRVYRYPKISEECSSRAGTEFQKLLAAEDNSNAALYVLLRAVDRFAATYKRYPGVFDSEIEDDICQLKSTAADVLNDIGSSGASIPDDLVSEICRFGAAELHCVAAVVGGIAAQESIKLLTGQFMPLSGPLIYNAISATSTVFNC
ncbi:NEDD8-activating enzyme E1 regulatory subunit [Marchantia polymorpha subsp. ruderalis]|uniref:NEDD8-activating enzyme E1 regulatory subunit n=2 Tax=Marchantia polymorpha TaxID=3197 RepID=A0AAF6ALN7_MARPO|nr:hypothetical protein MARPO_0005s0094 [Marchantia polymorpha]BBM97357.1 hypothetical protein Mp_1g05130 [Marchantia polymorpha subsp. ruderalis]|eukprot:PTQ48448.1 hypothetical protein MARPO_0005s0094 [Marchantia polymorpha]